MCVLKSWWVKVCKLSFCPFQKLVDKELMGKSGGQFWKVEVKVDVKSEKVDVKGVMMMSR